MSKNQKYLSDRVLKFTIRCCLSLIIIQILWSFCQPYYETLLYTVFIKAGRYLTSLPFGPLQINYENRFFVYIGDILFFPNINWHYTANIVFASLMFASSRIRFYSRIKRISVGLVVLFVAQILITFCEIYRKLFQNYDNYFQNGMNMNAILKYDSHMANFFINESIHFEMMSLYVLSIGLWAVMVFLYKKESNFRLPESLL